MKKLPPFYQQPVLLRRDEHSELTIAESPHHYRFASAAQTVIIASAEFFNICRQCPIIFAGNDDGQIIPLALMGLEKGENLFIDASGRWLGEYIPAYVRRYPFITTEDGTGKMVVCFDQSYDGFNRDGGVPLFEAGEPSAKMKEIVSFLNQFYLWMKQTDQIGDVLTKLDLLRQMTARVDLADGRSLSLKGMLVVSETRLTQLPDTDIVRLFRNGMLGFINAHLLSLRNLNTLLARKAARSVIAGDHVLSTEPGLSLADGEGPWRISEKDLPPRRH